MIIDLCVTLATHEDDLLTTDNILICSAVREALAEQLPASSVISVVPFRPEDVGHTAIERGQIFDAAVALACSPVFDRARSRVETEGVEANHAQITADRLVSFAKAMHAAVYR